MDFYIKALNDLDILKVARDLGIVVNRNNKSLCFLHKELQGSLSFNIENNYWHCFGCGVGGNVINLVEHYYNISFSEACKYLNNTYISHSEQVNYTKRQATRKNAENKIINVDYEVNDWIINNCKLTKKAKQYLIKDRCLNEEVLRAHNIKSVDDITVFYNNLEKKFSKERLISAGYYVKDGTHLRRVFYECGILFPYYNYRNMIQAIQLRAYNKKLYLFSKNSKLCFFNEKILSNTNSNKPIFITEGVIDCLTLLANNYCSISVPSSSILSLENRYLLYKSENFILFDNDESGKKNSKKLHDILLKDKINSTIVKIEGYNDINDMYRGKKQ